MSVNVTCDVVWFAVRFKCSVRQVERHIKIIDNFDVTFDNDFKVMILEGCLEVLLYSLTLWSAYVLEHCQSVVSE